MQKLRSVIPLFFLTIITQAQKTVNSSGNTLTLNNVSYSYSIGEIGGFYLKPNCMYSQGVIQAVNYLCNPKKIELNNSLEILIYPNPTRDFIIVETDYPYFSRYNILTFDGRIVQSGKFTYTPINVKSLLAGVYLIQLLSLDNKIIKTSKILKTTL